MSVYSGNARTDRRPDMVAREAEVSVYSGNARTDRRPDMVAREAEVSVYSGAHTRVVSTRRLSCLRAVSNTMRSALRLSRPSIGMARSTASV